jgi:telomerase protein component 1
MAAIWKTVRVFISSTFRDMQSERDWLVRFVFPKLRQELLQRRIHLVDVDLRWGVTSEQDALSVCREVVDECRPRFLCMLGGRYGWVPPGKTRCITADEVHYGVLDRDLKSRGFAYFHFRDPSERGTPSGIRRRHGSWARKVLAGTTTGCRIAKQSAGS